MSIERFFKRAAKRSSSSCSEATNDINGIPALALNLGQEASSSKQRKLSEIEIISKLDKRQPINEH